MMSMTASLYTRLLRVVFNHVDPMIKHAKGLNETEVTIPKPTLHRSYFFNPLRLLKYRITTLVCSRALRFILILSYVCCCWIYDHYKVFFVRPFSR